MTDTIETMDLDEAIARMVRRLDGELIGLLMEHPEIGVEIATANFSEAILHSLAVPRTAAVEKRVRREINAALEAVAVTRPAGQLH